MIQHISNSKFLLQNSRNFPPNIATEKLRMKHEDFTQQNIFSINNHKSSESVLIVDFSLSLFFQ